MRILIVNTGKIPVHLYGGTERVIWGLGKELVKMGHDVTFLVEAGSFCDFAEVRILDGSLPIVDQIKGNYDLIHFNFQPEGIENVKVPYIITMHGNVNDERKLDRNTVFVSGNHAARFGSTCYVHNGLDWSEYLEPELSAKRRYFHFLGNASWRVKNVQGAIDVIKKTAKERLVVLGGVRFNFNMGIRFTFTPRVKFTGMVGGEKKYRMLNESKGLIFPVKWHEPFGLAVIESLFYGCPVFGTPYGSLPELVPSNYGYLTNNAEEMAHRILEVDQYNPEDCHRYALTQFNSKIMTENYLSLYKRVLQGEVLNSESPQLVQVQKTKWLEWR